jgi:lactoylglutathione lyase
MKKQLFSSLLIFLFSFCCLTVMSQEKKGATFNHMALYVTDLKKSTWFYREIIGLDTMPEPFHDGRHTWFQISEHGHLHLISGAAGPKLREKDTHLCFSVPQLSEVVARLDKNKIPYENWAGESSKITRRVDGVQQIYFKDPDGFWIEINDDRER